MISRSHRFESHPQQLRRRVVSLFLVFVCAGSAHTAHSEEEPAIELPEGVKVVWEMEKAWREVSPTRERICLNGLWRWQPAEEYTETVPASNWGYFKVPGAWPGITDYMQKDFHRVYAHPSWAKIHLRTVTAAWYERQFAVPANWVGRVIVLRTSYLNSRAIVFINRKKIGQIRFPAGEVELREICEPGKTYTLSLYVEALPHKEVMISYTDTAAPREVRGRVARRGLCGDVFLEARPPGPVVGTVRVETSVRTWEITFHQELVGLTENNRYRLKAVVRGDTEEVAQFTSSEFTAADLAGHVYRWTVPWKN